MKSLLYCVGAVTLALMTADMVQAKGGNGGKGTSAAGFTGKATRTPEEYTDALLQLFERCRSMLGKD